MAETLADSAPEPFGSVVSCLRRNNMQAQYVPCKGQAVEAVSALLRKGGRHRGRGFEDIGRIGHVPAAAQR